MNCQNYLLFPLLMWSTLVFAQDAVDTVKLPALPPLLPSPRACMSNYAAQVYQNKSFAAIATGQSKTSDLANYAAFDPTKGDFTLNGFIAFSKKIKAGGVDDSSRSFLSFSFQGGLLNNSATTLFQNAKLNTSVTLSAKYHFRLESLGIGKTYIQCKATEVKGEELRRLVLEDSLMVQSIDKKFDRKLSNYTLLLLQGKDATIPLQVNELKTQLQDILLQLQNPGTDNPLDRSESDSLSKKASALLKGIDSLGKLTITNRLNEDSITTILQHFDDSVKSAKASIRKTYQQKILQTELSTNLFSMKQNWFTAIAAVNNQKYYTFFQTLPFAQQLSKNTFTTYSFGLQYNLYWQNLTDAQKRRVDYFNFGLIQQRNNNTGDIGSQTINQKTTLTENDTTREISTSYTAYTSPVVSFNEWNLYFNYYHLFGPTVFSGFHVYPSVEFRNNGETLLNAGLGYVVSLPNKTSGSPTVNAEVYFNFTDLTNDLHASTSLFQRGQLGISIGLPFNFLTK
jgi:hypothetical protein